MSSSFLNSRSLSRKKKKQKKQWAAILSTVSSSFLFQFVPFSSWSPPRWHCRNKLPICLGPADQPGVKSTLNLGPHSVPTVFRLYSDSVPTVFRLSSYSVPTLFQLCSDSVPTVFHLYSDSVPTVFRLSFDCVPSQFRLCSDYVPTMFLSSSEPSTIERRLSLWLIVPRYLSSAPKTH